MKYLCARLRISCLLATFVFTASSREQETLSSSNTPPLTPLSPLPLSLSPSDPGLAYRSSGLSLRQDWIISKDCVHLLPQVCLAAGGYALGPESIAVGL